MAENQESKGELVEQNEAQRFLPAHLMPSSQAELFESPALYTTLDLTKPENRGRLYDMVVEGGENSKEFINQSFGIEDVVLHPISFASKETGEIINAVRVVLLTDDGRTVQFVSAGIFTSLALMKDCGWRPFGPMPMKFTLKAIPLDGGRQFYKLIRVRPDVPAKKK